MLLSLVKSISVDLDMRVALVAVGFLFGVAATLAVVFG